jgi:predicted ABC-type ATPase
VANVVVIAGPNGAGKSTMAPRILRDALAVREFVNADTIATGLSAFSPETVAVPAARIMLKRVRQLASERRDFAFETTLASLSFAPWLARLRKDDGYRVHLVYIGLASAELAVARVAERVKRGGHAVPQPVVRRRYDRSFENFLQLYRALADSWMMVDNSVEPIPSISSDGSAGANSCAKDDAMHAKVLEAAGVAVKEALRDHKRAGNSIAAWRDGRVVWVPPDEIED